MVCGAELTIPTLLKNTRGSCRHAACSSTQVCDSWKETRSTPGRGPPLGGAVHARDFPVMGCLTRVPTDHRQKASVWPPPRHSFRLLSCSSQQREGFSAGLRVQPGAGLGPADVSCASGGGSVGETPVGGWILKAALATLRSSGVPWDRTGFRQWRQGQLWGFSGSCKMAGESGPGCWMLAGDLLLTLRADGGQRLCPDHRSQPSFRAVEGRD